MPEPTLQLDFGDAAVATEAFRLLATDPTTARDAGVSMSQEFRVVPVDADPAWRVRFGLGPLTREDARVLRRSVGARLMLRVENAGPAVRSDEWMGTPTDAVLTDVRVLPFSPDVAHGASYEVELTFGGLPAAVPFIPPGPDTLPPPPDPAGPWRNIPDILQPPDDPPGPFGRPFLPGRPAFTGQAAVMPGAFCRPVVMLAITGLEEEGPDPPTNVRITGRRVTFEGSTEFNMTFEWLARDADGRSLWSEYRLVQTRGAGGTAPHDEWAATFSQIFNTNVQSGVVAGTNPPEPFAYRLDVRTVDLLTASPRAPTADDARSDTVSLAFTLGPP